MSAHEQPGSVLLVVTEQNLADSNCFRSRVVLNVSVIKTTAETSWPPGSCFIDVDSPGSFVLCVDIRMDQATNTREDVIHGHSFLQSWCSVLGCEHLLLGSSINYPDVAIEVAGG